jgi:hypothetical protein
VDSTIPDGGRAAAAVFGSVAAEAHLFPPMRRPARPMASTPLAPLDGADALHRIS